MASRFVDLIGRCDVAGVHSAVAYEVAPVLPVAEGDWLLLVPHGAESVRDVTLQSGEQSTSRVAEDGCRLVWWCAVLAAIAQTCAHARGRRR